MKYLETKYLIISLVIVYGCSEELSKETPTEGGSIEASEWDLVWSDEFNEEFIDEGKWNKLEWRPGWVNNELQAYTGRDTNLFIEDGNLVIRGLIEPGYFGADYNGAIYNTDYTSGRLNTDDKFSWTYGRFDIRAKLPKGKGSWPAIWMLGENITNVGWPKCGEIDIMEHVGFDDGHIHGAIHTEDYNHMNDTQKSGGTYIATATDSFHVYSLEWTPTYLRYLIDGNSYFFVYNDGNGNLSKWPFDEPHYIILNLAIGGDWGALQGIDHNAFPMEMLVDYVKVYEKNENFNNINVTLKVDMKNENVSGTGLWLSGGSIGSGHPGGLQMEAVPETSLWEINLLLPTNSDYTYKFRNGYYPDTWSGGWESLNSECGVGQHNDRFLSVGIQDIVLETFCFGECEACEE